MKDFDRADSHERPTQPAGPARRRSPLVPLLIVGALFLGIAGGGVAGAAATYFLFSPTSQVKSAAAAVEQPAAPALTTILDARAADLTDIRLDGTVAGIYEQVGPGVVTVAVKQAGQASVPRNRLPQSPDQPQQPDQSVPEAEGEGSGFIVDNQGHILTNHHVVDGATEISVRLIDGSEIPARVVGTAPDADLALIQADIPADKLVIVPLGDSEAVQPGDPAVAIGSPFGLDHTVTAGIVSGVNREFGTASGRPMRGLIQTDAPVNPGNSGGPILNAKGEVIGIATSIESPVRGSVGVGFAVPSNTAKRLLPKLAAGEKIEHAYLGISGVPITQSLADKQKLPVTSGILVVDVATGGPAEKAGLLGGTFTVSTELPTGGDVIVAIEKTPVKNVAELSGNIETKSVGDTVTLSILRDGKPLDLTVILGAWPTSQQPG